MKHDDSRDNISTELLNYVENIVNINISSTNIVIIDRRNTGKTTIFTHLALKFVKKNFVIILDSTNQYVEKSLIKKLEKADIIQSKFLFYDMYLFLEKRIEQKSDYAKTFYLNIYRRQIERVLSSLSELKKPCVLIFDDIEFDEKILMQIKLSLLKYHLKFFVTPADCTKISKIILLTCLKVFPH